MKREELHFELPGELSASAPAEARGLRRDEVRLLVVHRDSGQIEHRRFYEIGDYLRRGDVVVLNASATRPAALRGTTESGQEIEARLSAQWSRNHGGRIWQAVVEPEDADLRPGTHLSFGGGRLAATVVGRRPDFERFWLIEFELNGRPMDDWLMDVGQPIRYDYVKGQYGLDAYQTVYAQFPGSAEMPSAGRAFTPELLASLCQNGVYLARIILHTGVSGLPIEEEDVEQHAMYEEWYQVTPEAAQAINHARERGGRVIAVGTTVTRTLETVADEDGVIHEGEGWTTLYITPGYRFKAVDGLVTGLHEPDSTRMVLAVAFAGSKELMLRAYQEAISQKYLWHEFGDVSLIL
jgi:S-adenosylmethionine:tRNA ribosyltransferase-isomerase